MSDSLKIKHRLCIVIPSYNEELRLPLDKYRTFLSKNKDSLICFVNDGSSDNTLGALEELRKEFNANTEVISNQRNLGKAETVRNGINYCTKKFDLEYIAYLDADLSTSLKECLSLTSHFKKDIQFVFGSRIMKIGSKIKRSQLRFLIGRFIATIISNILKLPVYDTQCGCKIFKTELAVTIFKTPFISKWLFDVEIFQRIIILYGRKKALTRMLEAPLKKWIDCDKSKVKLSYFFNIWTDLYLINRINKRAKTNKYVEEII